jgi:hypothetical protein
VGVVVFELGSLATNQGVFDSKRMQPEFLPQVFQVGGCWVDQVDPNSALSLALKVFQISERDVAVDQDSINVNSALLHAFILGK